MGMKPFSPFRRLKMELDRDESGYHRMRGVFFVDAVDVAAAVDDDEVVDVFDVVAAPRRREN